MTYIFSNIIQHMATTTFNLSVQGSWQQKVQTILGNQQKVEESQRKGKGEEERGEVLGKWLAVMSGNWRAYDCQATVKNKKERSTQALPT